MAAYDDITRRWMMVLSPNTFFGGGGFVAEPARRRSSIVRVGASSRRLGHRSVGTSRTLSIPSGVAMGSAVLTAAPPAPRPILGESLFRGVVDRETKRAERFNEPLVLLLVRLSAAAPSAWPEIIDGVIAATSDTDMLGWVSEEKVLGVVLTDSRAAREANALTLEAHVRLELAARLDPDTLGALSLQLHFHAATPAAVAAANPADPVLCMLRPHGQQPALKDAVKRGLDVVGSGLLLLMLAPLLLLIAALIKWKSPGPILFRQVRIGRNAQPFTILKFRSMRVDADVEIHQQYVTDFIKSRVQPSQGGENGVYKLTRDSRVTPLGRLLRKTSLDELPQLWNVFRGEMSLVGPRPPLPYEVAEYAPWHYRRLLEVKPGITGLWQVTGRSRTTFDEMVRLDLRYVRTRSFRTDLKILLATPRAVFDGKGAC